MSQLRWNPLLKEWVIINPRRKSRPNLPSKITCPFCPGAPEVGPSADWKVLAIPNKFPSLGHPDETASSDGALMKMRPGIGRCEVVIYTPSHETLLSSLELSLIEKIVEKWTERFRELGNLDEISYVLIFENKGRFIGVSLDHPHCQIYAFPFIPPVIERELKNAKEYGEAEGSCIFCDQINRELEEKARIVIENEEFLCFMPFYATWPYGTHIYPKKHVQSLLEFTPSMNTAFASIIKQVLAKYDKLFGEKLAYEMILHQAPTDGNEYLYYHFHVEIYVQNRGKDKMKYLGGCEQGGGVFVNPALPEETAKELRNLSI